MGAGWGYHAGVSAEEPRHFTPAEAEALLPEIDRLLEEVQTLVARFDQLASSAQSNGHVRRSGEANAEQSIETEVQGIVERIQAQGVIVRDLRAGLIDFPSRRDERTVFLCWKRGEPLRIEWWHPTDTGIAGRQRL
jgi:hypothetical protein